MDFRIFAGKTLMNTGCMGSFGNTSVKMGSKVGFGQIRIFDREEKNQGNINMYNRLKVALPADSLGTC